MTTLTWLHLSDLHARPAATGWDAARGEESLLSDLEELKHREGFVPDLILFTSDAAFGEVGTEPEETMRGQLAVFGDLLDRIRRTVAPDFPWESVFLVPGNHDVNRTCIDPAHTAGSTPTSRAWRRSSRSSARGATA